MWTYELFWQRRQQFNNWLAEVRLEPVQQRCRRLLRAHVDRYPVVIPTGEDVDLVVRAAAAALRVAADDSSFQHSIALEGHPPPGLIGA
jgi:hypothetical protein